MTFLRSLIFFFYFALVSVVMHVAALPTLILPRLAVVRISQAWAAVEVTGAAPQNPNACGGGTTNQNPVANFTATPNGLTVAFNGSTSTDADGTIASYAWNFGDGGTATGATPGLTRVPSGKMAMGRPAATTAFACPAIRRSALAPAARSMPITPERLMYQP